MTLPCFILKPSVLVLRHVGLAQVAHGPDLALEPYGAYNCYIQYVVPNSHRYFY